MKWFKKALSVIMAGVLSFTSFVNMSATTAYADSNNRIATYINLAKSKEETDVDLSGLTEDQLRFLGVWLSNYFSPFMMEITGDNELTDSIKEEMAKALTTNLSFSEDLAKQLVEIVYGYMKATAQPIYIAIKDGNTYKPFNEDGNLSYATFIAAMSGGGNMLGGGLSGVATGTKKEVGLVMHSEDTSTPDIKYHTIHFTVDGREVGGPICSWNDLSSYVNPDFTFYFQGVGYEWMYNGSSVSFIKSEDMKTQISSISSKLKNAKSFSEAHAAYWSNQTDDTLEDLMYSSLSLIAVNWSMLCNDQNVSLTSTYETPFNFFIGDEDDVSISYTVSQSFKEAAKNAGIMLSATITEEGFSGATSSFPADEGFFVFKAEDGSYHPVANFYASDKTGTFTDSQLAFAKCLASGNTKMGYGYSITDFTNSDIGETQDNGYEYLVALQKEKSLTPEQVSSMTTYGTTMCVDCFGNIIQAGGVHQRVIIPACMNPYAWIGVNSDGTDKEGSGGQVLQGANFIHMGDLGDTLVGSLDSGISVDYSSFSLDDAGDNRSTLRAHINSNETQVKWDAGGEAWNNSFLSSYIIAGSKDPLIAAERKQQGIWWGEKHTFVVPVPTGEGDASDAYTNVVLIDTLGAYDTGKAFNAFNVASFKGESSFTISNASSLFGSALDDVDKPMISWGDETAAAATCLYITYCWASLYEESAKADTVGKLGYRLWKENLPSMKNKGINIAGSDERLDTIINWIYYLLHPTAGFNYVTTWLTNKINHLLLGFHSSMVGTNGVGVTTGTTKYRSHMGYVTTPDLSEIQWTDSLINLYNSCIPFLIILLLIIMVFAYLTGVLNLQHAILGLLMFSIFTVMPVNLINAMVGESNRISQKIYGDKFTYWALIQNETYATAIDNAVAQGQALDEETGGEEEGQTGTSKGYANYLRTLYGANGMVYSNQGSESILLKWQAPKKMASLVLSAEDAKSVSGLGEQGRQMLQGMLNKTYSGQSYTEDVDAVYMYRSYLDIANFSRYVWKYLGNKGFSYTDVYKNQFVDNALSSASNPENYTMNTYFPMNIDVFNFGIASFNQDAWDVEKYFAPTGGFENDSDRVSKLSSYISSNGGTSELPKLAAHALYSENVYYYFSWKLYTDGLSPDSSISGTTGYKDTILKDGGSYFYDKDSGDLLDVMNMRELFSSVIPYMKQGNDIVRAFDDVYGIYIYDDVPTEEGHWNDAEVSNDPEWKSKYWHNLNVSRLYGIYCPWVDVMYDCSYSDPEEITVMGERFTVVDPLDPKSYEGSGRQMIFSEKEMHDYGLGEGDLTAAERLILQANKGYAERLFDLLNYYNFSDVSLDSAAAINCAFEFNNVFSESGMFSANHNIYPQSFDLANFSYDAYLRFILANTTGEDMLSAKASSGEGTAAGETSGDFYERIVNNSSTATVLVMLILDIISIYILPAFRIFFLVAMFFTSFIIILVSAFKIEDNLKFAKKVLVQFLLPLLGYFAATVLFSWILSLFMGTGNSAVTQTGGVSISMGDPTVVMMVMIALDILLLIVYFKIIQVVVRDMKHGLKMVGGFLGGLGGAAVGFASGAVAGVAGGIAGVAGGIAGSVGNGGRGIRDALRRRKYNKQHQDEVDAMKDNTKALENAQKGTDIENPRANRRGSNGASDREDARDVARGKSVKEKQEIREKTSALNKKAESGNIVQVEQTKSEHKKRESASRTVEQRSTGGVNLGKPAVQKKKSTNSDTLNKGNQSAQRNRQSGNRQGNNQNKGNNNRRNSNNISNRNGSNSGNSRN